jgi:NADPH:quinone reductase-like Zn-dependent oxidoreductase
MKAIVYRRYGSADVLSCEEVDAPAAGPDEVVVDVRAASANPLDWHLMTGQPYVGRLAFGLARPRITRLGADVAGQVRAVGSSVTRFEPGDEVFGTCRGAFAEQVSAAESALVTKPANVTFEEAASVPIAGFTALQALRDKGQLRAGQKVLINGAAGGVGTFAVQIAKALGAEVAGVCSTRNVDLVRSIGADRVVDHTREDFTGSGPRYDLMLDCIGNHSLSACRSVLAPRGRYVLVGGPDGRWVGPLGRTLGAMLLSPFVSQSLVTVLARRSPADLLTLRDLMATGRIRPVVDRRYGLAEVPEAIRYLQAGHARGKVVITVRPAAV